MISPIGTVIAPVHIPWRRTSGEADSPRSKARRRARRIIWSVTGPEQSSPRVLL